MGGEGQPKQTKIPPTNKTQKITFLWKLKYASSFALKFTVKTQMWLYFSSWAQSYLYGINISFYRNIYKVHSNVIATCQRGAIEPKSLQPEWWKWITPIPFPCAHPTEVTTKRITTRATTAQLYSLQVFYTAYTFLWFTVLALLFLPLISPTAWWSPCLPLSKAASSWQTLWLHHGFSIWILSSCLCELIWDLFSSSVMSFHRIQSYPRSSG